MADYTKIGLLVLNPAQTKFLVCQKYPQNMTDSYIMPGGQFTEDSIEECLKNETREELNCEVDLKSLAHVGTYVDVAAGPPGKTVEIRLYQGKIIGEPKPSTEVEFLHWIGAIDEANPRVSQIIRNKIIPDLLKKQILKAG